MLTDIFAHRYADVTIFEVFTEPVRRLLVQGFRIIEEQIRPYWIDGKESANGKAFWSSLNKQLAMELGLENLSQEWTNYQTEWVGKKTTQTYRYTAEKICKNWMFAPIPTGVSADQYIKERLSLIELGFRKRELELTLENANLPNALTSMNKPTAMIGTGHGRLPLPGDRREAMINMNAFRNSEFKNVVDELNTRFRHAGMPLHYHNGFIQIATDPLVQDEVETPFWSMVSDPVWKNVDHDMKEALDLRDSGGRDPAFYSARALESTIKIISETKGWTHGGEKGAHNYIDNLGSKKNGFIMQWEAASLKDFFTHVRNPFGHGPGSAEMPKLSQQQTEWAIEFCMSWIKNLIRRS
jgi:hypothetical protein